MTDEQTLLEVPGARITTARAQFENATYPIAHISAVRRVRIPPKRLTGFLLFALGASVALYVAQQGGDKTTGFAAAAVFGAAGIVLLALARARHVVVLQTSGGQVEAFDGEDDEAARIAAAVEDAIVRRG